MISTLTYNDKSIFLGYLYVYSIQLILKEASKYTYSSNEPP